MKSTFSTWVQEPRDLDQPTTAASVELRLDWLFDYHRSGRKDAHFIGSAASSFNKRFGIKEPQHPEFSVSANRIGYTWKPDPCTMTLHCNEDAESLDLDVCCTVTTAFIGSSKCKLTPGFWELRQVKAQKKVHLVLKASQNPPEVVNRTRPYLFPSCFCS